MRTVGVRGYVYESVGGKKLTKYDRNHQPRASEGSHRISADCAHYPADERSPSVVPSPHGGVERCRSNLLSSLQGIAFEASTISWKRVSPGPCRVSTNDKALSAIRENQPP